jgi:uncharacterized protein YqjF (DUF2071 family)
MNMFIFCGILRSMDQDVRSTGSRPERTAPPGAPSSPTRPFLTARWRQLAMLNYVASPETVRPHVPAGTEPDEFEGRAYASVVGFMFEDARIGGWKIPFHRHFEEVNLRIYVRRRAPDGWHRGVAFVKELVPRWAIAWVARWVYGENYVSLPMSHRWSAGDPPGVRYAWTLGGREMAIDLEPEGPFRSPAPESEEAFISDHFWGYSSPAKRGVLEYRVEHPRWRVASARWSAWTGDAALLYGAPWGEILSRPPDSAFLAEGSEVTVYRGCPL